MREQLKTAYPQTPASFDARMRNTLAHLPPHRPRNALRSAVAIALAAVISLCGLAFAASQSDLLRQLFGGAEPTPQAERLLMQLGSGVERDGVTLTIDEYLLDGADLYVRWTVSSARSEPLMLMVSDLETGLDAVSISEDSEANWTFGSSVLLDENHPSYSATSRLNFVTSAPSEAFDVSFTAALLRPLARVVDDAAAEAFADTPTLIRAEAEECTMLWAVSDLEIEGDAHVMSSDYMESLETQTFDGLLQALTDDGYAEEVLTLPVRFDVVPDAENIVHTEIVGTNVFSFDKFTMIVDRADFTAAGVNIRYHIVARDADNAWDGFASRLWFDVLPDGQRTDNAFTQSKSGAGRILTGEIVARAGSTIPSRVLLLPYDDETNQFYSQYAIEIRLKCTK